MSDTLQQPTTPEEQAEVNYGEQLIWRLMGARITMFGANATGEIILSVEKDGVSTKLVIGKDETGDVSLFELEGTQESAL